MAQPRFQQRRDLLGTRKLIVQNVIEAPEQGVVQDLRVVCRGNDQAVGTLLQDGDLLITRSNTPELVGRCGIYRDVGAPGLGSLAICDFAYSE